jgi:hypothetical protein
MNSKLEWEPFRVGEPSRDPKLCNVDCTPFDTVFHICHVKDAYRILEDGKIRSSLVWDESRLKNSRTCVSWVSPNTWAQGSIYGNICFEFPWPKLVDQRNLFWVEGIQHYNPPAYRILVTDKGKHLPKLQAYDPTRRRGPVYHDAATDTWYRNGEFTGEFLVDGDLSLEDCRRLSFVNHHEKRCKRKPCGYIGEPGKVAGARLLAMLMGNRVDCGKNLFLDSDNSRNVLHEGAVEALKYLLARVLVHPGRSGVIKASSSSAKYLATAIFARAGRGGKDGLRKLCGLFVDRDELRIALGNRIRRHFRMRSVCQLEKLS